MESPRVRRGAARAPVARDRPQRFSDYLALDHVRSAEEHQPRGGREQSLARSAVDRGFPIRGLAPTRGDRIYAGDSARVRAVLCLFEMAAVSGADVPAAIRARVTPGRIGARETSSTGSAGDRLPLPA